MSPKKRSKANAGLVDNLYRAKDRRTGSVYYRYLDKRTGKYHGLGTDHNEAMDAAKALNAAIAQQIINIQAKRILAGRKHQTITVHKMTERYLKLQADKARDGEIRQTTVTARALECKAIAKAWKSIELGAITTKDCADLIATYKDAGKARMAQAIRARLIDIFAEAIALGEIDANNPAMLTKQPVARTKRARLTLEQWNVIKGHTVKPWVGNAMLLALVTGQRLTDISNMRFSQVRKVDGVEYLHVTQGKTGTRVRIPTALRMDAIGLSIRDVITQCRDRVLSPYLLHHVTHAGRARPGNRIRAKTLSNEFAAARGKAGIDWQGSNPATFHEMRSLSERLYKAQGIDTKSLLGHRHQSMTDKYNDSRGSEWVTVGV